MKKYYIAFTLVVIFGFTIYRNFFVGKEIMLPIQHWMTSTKTPVYFVNTPELPILELRLIFDAGSARDGQYSGIAELTHNLLSEGTEQVSAEQVADRFENIGAIFSTSSDQDMAVISLRTLTQKKFLDSAIDTLSIILNKPAFSPLGFEHQKKLLLSFLEHQEQLPGDLAENAFFALLYPGHPYATPPAGTRKDILKVTPQKIADFYYQYYAAQNARIIMVGDLTHRQAEEIAEKIVKNLPKGVSAPKLTQALPLKKAVLQKIPYQSAQTHILVGQVGIHRNDPNYFSLYLGNYLLGGDPLISQLGESVREKNGLAYDIRSYFLPLAYKGPFLIGFQTRNEKAALALEMTKNTLKHFIAHGPTSAQLQVAKDNIVKGYGLHFDSNAAIANNLIVLAFYQLPLNYFDTFVENISEITPSQVHDVFKKYIDPEKMVVVSVGPGK